MHAGWIAIRRHEDRRSSGSWLSWPDSGGGIDPFADHPAEVNPFFGAGESSWYVPSWCSRSLKSVHQILRIRMTEDTPAERRLVVVVAGCVLALPPLMDRGLSGRRRS